MTDCNKKHSSWSAFMAEHGHEFYKQDEEYRQKMVAEGHQDFCPVFWGDECDCETTQANQENIGEAKSETGQT